VAFLLGGMVDLVLHFVGSGPFLLGILEDATTFKFEGLEELEKFLMVFFGLAGEAGDEGGSDGEVRNALSHALQEIPDVFSVGFAVHLIEHVVGDVLQGNVDVAGDLGAFRDCLDEFV